MREMKFKAKTIGNEWVFGNVSHLKKDFSTARKGYYISNSAGAPFAYMVRPETICQFTGIQDKKGVDIYDGDIVRKQTYPQSDFEVTFSHGKYNISDYYNPLVIIGNIHDKFSPPPLSRLETTE